MHEILESDECNSYIFRLYPPNCKNNIATENYIVPNILISISATLINNLWVHLYIYIYNLYSQIKILHMYLQYKKM